MRSRTVFLAAAVAVFLVGACRNDTTASPQNRDAEAQSGPAGAVSGTPSRPADAGAKAAEAAERAADEGGDAALCFEIQQRFLAIVDKASGACTKADDCGCYNPVAPGLGCGGVTDKATATRLFKVQEEFLKAGCSWPLNCSAWICKPVCENGRCWRVMD